ncbi:hypothetical protein FM125_06420 [Micrococcus lylae]|uniref:DUF4345 domain-containing protein n=1 Tax=Micrococcus lylae TaxID=1273 RepID=A0A1R4J514_9MICC|nr:hypothetical protein [Micrococcus lylae]SJN26865.1 hypothetical protein FM125_06420 [Micrococcus lylae]
MPYRRATTALHRYGRRLGRRGIILATLGTLWAITGALTIVAPDPAAAYPLLSAGHGVRAAGWVATGAVAVVCAHLGQCRDAPGWAALYVMAAYRALAYGHGLLLVALGDPHATIRSAFGLASWLALLIVIRVCSGWREHHDDPLHTGAIPTITDRR